MALPLQRTLGELRSDIQVRLGFGVPGGVLRLSMRAPVEPSYCPWPSGLAPRS